MKDWCSAPAKSHYPRRALARPDKSHSSDANRVLSPATAAAEEVEPAEASVEAAVKLEDRSNASIRRYCNLATQPRRSPTMRTRLPIEAVNLATYPQACVVRSIESEPTLARQLSSDGD